MIRSSSLKANPVGELRQRRATDRMLCCCMSMTNRLPLLLPLAFSAKAPQSVKKMLPVLLETMRECGPSRGEPSYSLTSSVYALSVALRLMTDWRRRSVR